MYKVLKNASWIIICRIVQAVLALIISMITARYLGPSNYGLLNYAISVVAFVIPVMKLGLSSIIVQELISEPEKEGETLGTCIALNLVSSLVCVLGSNLFVIAANHNEIDTILVCVLYSTILIFQSFELFNYWFQAKLLAKYSSIVSLIAYGIVAIYKIFLLITQKSIYWFSVANTLDCFIIAVGLYFVFKKISGIKLSFNWERGKRLLSVGKYYIISDLMVVIFAQTDRIMLKAMLDNAATGYYSAAVTCAGMTQFVFGAIIDSFRPSIFEGQKISDEIFEHRLTLLYSIIVYSSLAQSVLMTICAKYVIRILYGSAYAPAAGALMIVVWYTTFSYIGSVRNIWILAKGKQKYLWQINLIGATANVALNAIMIPILGIYGASIASLATQFFTNVVVGFIIYPIKDNNRLLLRSLKPETLVAAWSRLKSELQKGKL